MGPDDYLKNNTGNPSADLNFGVDTNTDTTQTKTKYEETASGESVTSQILPDDKANSAVEMQANIFAQSTMPLWGNLMEQSIGRLIGEMPTESDKAIMNRLLDYIPEKSKGISHAIMANAARSLRGDPQASGIAAKLLEEKQSWDTKQNALHFGILKLADPNTSESAKRSVMAAIRNNWDDIYGPDKSTKMLQSAGFLAQIGSVFEALSAKAAASGAGRLQSYGGGGYQQPQKDLYEQLNYTANESVSRLNKRIADMKLAGWTDDDIKKDPTIIAETQHYQVVLNKIRELAPDKFGIDKLKYAPADLTSLGY